MAKDKFFDLSQTTGVTMGKHQENLDVPEHVKYIGVEPSEVRISYGDMTAVLLKLWNIFSYTTMTVRFASIDSEGVRKDKFTIYGKQKVGHEDVLTLGIPYTTKEVNKSARIHIMHSQLTDEAILAGINATGNVSDEVYIAHQKSLFFDSARKQDTPRKPLLVQSKPKKRIPTKPKSQPAVLALEPELVQALQDQAEQERDEKEKSHRKSERLRLAKMSYSDKVNDYLQGLGVSQHPMRKSDLIVFLRQVEYRYAHAITLSITKGIVLPLEVFISQVQFYANKEDSDEMLAYAIGFTLTSKKLAKWIGSNHDSPTSIEIFIHDPV